MAKLVKILAAAMLIAGAAAVTPGTAEARWHGGWHHHHGGYGGWGWAPTFGLGLGLGYAWGYPYYYGGNPYYAPPRCGWAHVRVWRYDHWAIRRVWRCW